MVPLGAAIGLVGYLVAKWHEGARTARVLAVGVIIVAVSNLAEIGFQTITDFRPGADKQTLGRHYFAIASRGEIHRQWRDVCAWIERETEPQAVFLTTRYQQTFKWYAQRPEVVSWKDTPQNAAAIVQWRKRMDDVFQVRYDLSRLSDVELIELGRRYGASYVLIDRTLPQERNLVRVYPSAETGRGSIYEVYRLVSRGDKDRIDERPNFE
jgi:hypothetical protein